MKIVFLTTTSPNKPEGHAQLMRSLNHHGWGSHVIEHPWRGFGDKIIQTYNFLVAHPEIDKFVYSDAWDSFCLATPAEVLRKMKGYWNNVIFSAECACYPHAHLAEQYPNVKTPWKYLNGGSWICTNENFRKMVDRCATTVDENDQVYSTNLFLNHNQDGLIKLDYSCALFQTTAFEAPEYFTLGKGRILNNLTNQKPCFAHGNGHTPMEKIYQLIPN